MNYQFSDNPAGAEPVGTGLPARHHRATCQFNIQTCLRKRNNMSVVYKQII